MIFLFVCFWGAAQDLESYKQEWLESKKEKDRLYAAKEDCDALMGFFSQDLIFYEKGDLLSYDWMVRYCPMLPKNLPNPMSSKMTEILLGPNTAYDVLDETFMLEGQRTARKVTTTLWKKFQNGWKIVHLNVSMHKGEDGPIKD